MIIVHIYSKKTNNCKCESAQTEQRLCTEKAQQSVNPPCEPPECDGGEKACGGFRARILEKRRGEGKTRGDVKQG